MARLCFLTERMLRGWGVDHCVHRLAEGLAERGHEVEVVCLRADRSYASPAYRIRVLALPPCPPEDFEDAVVARSGLIRQRPYDLFIASMYPFFGAAARLDLPFIYYEHGVVNPMGLDPRMQAILERIRRDGQRYQVRARRVAVISRFLMEQQVNPAAHLGTDVVYNGADSYGPAPAAAAAQAFREQLGLADAEVVGYVGRLERGTYKGVDELVHIVAALRARRPRARLLLVGRADTAARDHFAACEDVVVRTDVPEEDMPRYLAAMDVVVSASKWEGFNLPLAEAQFAGRPVVAYRLAAHPEVVAPSGALVATPAEFVQALAALLADPASRRRRGEEARAFAQRFTWAHAVEAMAACVRAAGVSN